MPSSTDPARGVLDQCVGIREVEFFFDVGLVGLDGLDTKKREDGVRFGQTPLSVDRLNLLIDFWFS